jgi:NADH-quinone oxidoreductase subunit E
LRGSDDVVAACKKHIAPAQHTVSADGKFSWMEVECLGACVNAPMLQIDNDFYEDLDGPTTEKLLEAFRRGETPKPGPQNYGRVSSEPAGGALTLKDPQLYNGGYARMKPGGGGATTDNEGKAPTKAASDRESPTQKPPGAAT